MPAITFYKHEPIPMEMHKVKIVQQLHLLPTAQRLEKMQQAGFNTFQLHNGDIFLDMLTDSGVNAMSDRQQAAMLQADDAYAGSETFFRMQAKLQELFGTMKGCTLADILTIQGENVVGEFMEFYADPASVEKAVEQLFSGK